MKDSVFAEEDIELNFLWSGWTNSIFETYQDEIFQQFEQRLRSCIYLWLWHPMSWYQYIFRSCLFTFDALYLHISNLHCINKLNWKCLCTFNLQSICAFNLQCVYTFNLQCVCILNLQSICTFNLQSFCTFNLQCICTFNLQCVCILNLQRICTFNLQSIGTFNLIKLEI